MVVAIGQELHLDRVSEEAVSHQPIRFAVVSKYDPIVPQLTALFRDTRAFAGILFSRQEVIRFFGIVLDQAMAALMA